MVFPPNRPGNIMGQPGASLRDLLEAIQAMQASIDALATATNTNAASIDALATAIGQQADTDCEASLLEIQCASLTVLGGKVGASPTPPALCPGFDGAVTYGPLTWLPVPPVSGETYLWYATLATAPAPWPFSGSLHYLFDGPDTVPLNYFTLGGGLSDTLSLCIRARGYGTGGSVDMYRLVPPMGTQALELAIIGAEYSGPASYTHTVNGPELYVFVQSTITGGTGPTAQLWASFVPGVVS